jgi:hypothetical protein
VPLADSSEPRVAARTYPEAQEGGVRYYPQAL